MGRLQPYFYNAALCVSFLSACCFAQEPSTTHLNLARTYTPGTILHYVMQGDNQGWKYSVDATDTVRQDSQGVFYEQIAWSNLTSNATMTLSPVSLAFRQDLSLNNSGKYLAVPNLSKVQPFLIGPITDLLTIYSDVSLAQRQGLNRVGQQFYFAYGKPDSWADGSRFLIAEDAIDFDLLLQSANPREHAVTLLVRHVPPPHPQVRLPAAWMQVPVAGAPNNWVQVSHSGSTFKAEVGKETFNVSITLDTSDGKILNAQITNPVTAISRECKNVELTECSPPIKEQIYRGVTLNLLP